MKRIFPFLALLLLIILTEWGMTNLAVILSPVKGEEPSILMHTEAISKGSAKDILFFGDSTAAYGLDAKLFERLTGERVENFSTNRHLAALTDLALLRRYLALHPPPKAIFLMRAVHMWEVSPREDIVHEYFPEIIPFLSNAPLPLEEEIHAFLAELLPSVRFSTTIRRRILGRKEILEDSHLAFLAPGSGSVVYTNNVLFARSPIPENLRLLGLFCDLTEHEGIPVFVSVAPSTYANADAIQAAIINFLHARGSDTCSYLRLPHLQNSQLSDTSHVNIEGADVLTRFAASVYLDRSMEIGLARRPSQYAAP